METTSYPDAEKSERNGLEIAIVGMSGRFPGANNINQFWENLKNGVNSIRFFTGEELLQNKNIDADMINRPNYVKAMGIIENPEYFDASFFGYSPQEAEILDPQIRVFSETCWEALEDAGCDPTTYKGSIGLFAGGSRNRSWEVLTIVSGKEEIFGEFAADNLKDKDFLSSRISHKLDLKGPAISMHTACSTALVATDLACRSLLTGQCDAALAGGVSVLSEIAKGGGYLYEEGLIFSPDGIVRAFDREANGTVFSHGAGVVLLKRLDDATAFGDDIYAVIKGFAANNDGITKSSFSAPAVDGQTVVIRTAMYMAEVEPETITYVEAHGTGTRLGDPIEIEALKTAFNSNKTQYCAIGSVKTNIGHLDTAAGAAGLIKVALMIKHRQIPPSLNYKNPNPEIDFENSPFFVNTRLREWKNNGELLRAGISSFGVGGTNAHLILEQAPEQYKTNPSARPYQLLLLSARTANALEQTGKNFLDYLKKNPHTNLADAAFTLNTGRKAFEHKKMLVCRDIKEARQILGHEEQPIQTHYAKEEKRALFMFPGQGSQYVDMARGVYETEPLFREEVDRCFEILKPLMGYDIKEIIYPHPDCRGGFPNPPQDCVGAPGQGDHRGSPLQLDQINQTENAQPLIFASEYALAKLLIAWGITPYAMIGHSIGEYTAACLAGVFSLEDALLIVTWRGKLMQQMPEGSMLSVTLPDQELKPLLIEGLALAAVNAPSQSVVSGPTQAIDTLARQLQQKGCPFRHLHTSHAFHSKMMAPIINTFEEKVRQITLNQPNIPFISNVTGKWITFKDAVDPKYWAKHLCRTVYFARGITELSKDRNSIFIEVGPGHTLSTFVKQHHNDKKPGHITVNLLRHPREKIPDDHYLLTKIGQIWLYGASPDWKAFYSRERRRRLRLPTYPFERRPYWIDGNPIKMITGKMPPGPARDKKTDIADWFYIPCWKRSLPIAPDPRPTRTKKIPAPLIWLVLVNEYPLCRQLAGQLKQAGENVITVKPGTSFKKISPQEYIINPQNYKDYDTLISHINESGKIPTKIVHAWGVTGNHQGLEESTLESINHKQDLGFYSLLYLARAIGRQNFREQLEIVVVTNDMQEVTGEENLCPGKSTILGPIKVIPQEYTNIICRSIDLSFNGKRMGKSRQKNIIEQILTEFTGNSLETVVAYRGNYRWVRTFEPKRIDEPQEPSQRLKEKGVYLVTGGLGQIGLVLAQYLVKSVKAKLVLTGRSFFPPQHEWKRWLTLHDEQEPTSTKIKILQELEKRGGKVMTARADIANPEQIQEVIKKAEARFGTINGIFHLAGIINGPSIELIDKITKNHCLQQFQSKIYGLLVLEKISRNKKLDFCWLMSSISAVLGGLGLGAYSAGNIFMDAFVNNYNRTSSSPWISVNWDNLEPGQSQLAFQRILSTRKANQVAVSPGGNLQDRIDRWIKLESLRQVDPSSREQNHPNLSALQPRPPLTTSYATPSNPLQQAIIDTWQKLFGFQPIGIYDSFFELGGDSLKAITAVSMIHKKLQAKVPLPEFFNRPSAAALAEYINNLETSEFTSIEPGEKQEYYNLPCQVIGLWLRYRFQEKERHPFNVHGVYDLDQVNVNKEMIERVWQTLVERHESLRTTFLTVNEEAKMKVHSPGSIETPFAYIDLRNRNGKNKIKTAEKIVNHRKNEDFDLEKGPVCRATLIQTEERSCKFVFVTHHIYSDELSKRIMEREFMILLDAYAKREKNPLKPLKIHNKDYAVWQRRRFSGKRGKKLEDFWLDYLGGELPASNLPMDYPENRRKGTYREILARDTKESFRKLTPAEHNSLIGTLNTARTVEGACYRFVLDHEIKIRLNELVLETDSSAFTVFSAALNILFYRLTGQKDSIIGAIVATREHEALEHIPGNFTNTLLYRNKVQETMTIKDYISYVAKNISTALQHREYLIEKILEQLDVALDSIGTLSLNYIKNRDNENVSITDFSPKHTRFDHVYFDIDFTVSEYSNGIMVHCKYNKKLFKPATIEFISEKFILLLDKMTHCSHKKIEDPMNIPQPGEITFEF